MKVNVNEWVKVRLNEIGVDILRRNHESIQMKFPKIGEFKEPKVDEGGYCKFQIWHFMQEFGPHLHLGMQLPFDSELIIAPQPLK